MFKYISYKTILLLIFIFLFITRSVFSEKNNQHGKNKIIHIISKKYESYWKKIFQKNKISYPPEKILIRAFKYEKVLEVFVKPKKSLYYQKIDQIKICKASGFLGPKYEQGDLQVPEGVYEITRLVPESEFHMAMEINFPNDADILRTNAKDPGDEIFIHGTCTSYGCLAVGNKEIEKLYWLFYKSTQSFHQKIDVHIFPYQFSQKKKKSILKKMAKVLEKKPEIINLWKSLEKIYSKFNLTKREIHVVHDVDGNYIINN